MGESQHLRLHYETPASQWSESLPIGNGRLGAVVYGRTDTELLQLNEDSVWYGGPQDRTPPDARRMLGRLRQLIRDEKHAEAEELAGLAFFSNPASMRHYEPMGTATLEFRHADVTEYSRHLDLATSEAVVEYKHQGESYRRDMIASYPDNALLMRFTATKKTRFIVRLDRLSDDDIETNIYADTIRSVGSYIVVHATPGGSNSNRLCSVLKVVCDDDDGEGTIEAIGGCLVVTSASCRIAIGAQTTFRHAHYELVATSDVDKALSRPWKQLVERHQADYCGLFNRMSLRMWPDASHLPTNVRLQSARDPGLVALYHNYGRYLLLSCSRAGDKALPATLQGIWNSTFAPRWGSKFTININTQMNYWPAAPCSLIDVCAGPLIDHLERMSFRGRQTARDMYGCRGWCAHHNTDIWADTSPQDRWMPATLWPLGGLWLSVDMMNTLRFQYDEALHRRLFDIHTGAVEFVLDFLIPSACGRYLVANPSISPENIFISKSGERGIFCEGSTMDMSLIRIALTQFLESSDQLSKTDENHPAHSLKQAVEDALSKIPPLTLNKDSLIQEWGLNDYAEDEPGHRHVSHLFSLHPGQLISPRETPDLADAARRVLTRRLAHGGGHTGWSRAWLLNMYARLHDADACGENMDLLLSQSTLPNMLDTHPPFQIDGNFGGCAGILECLVQSMERKVTNDVEDKEIVEVQLLPSCPKGWEKGKLGSVRVRQGWLVSFEWEHGEIVDPVELSCTQEKGYDVHILYPDGETVIVKGGCVGDHLVSRPSQAGK